MKFYFQDGAQFYDEGTNALVVSYPDLCVGDYSLADAQAAHARFIADHPEYKAADDQLVELRAAEKAAANPYLGMSLDGLVRIHRASKVPGHGLYRDEAGRAALDEAIASANGGSMIEIVGDFSRVRHPLSFMNRTVYSHAQAAYLDRLFAKVAA